MTLERGRHTEVQGYQVLYTFSGQKAEGSYLFYYLAIKNMVRPEILVRPWPGLLRRACALEHKDWTVEDWGKIIFSDESKFNLYKSNGCTHVRRN